MWGAPDKKPVALGRGGRPQGPTPTQAPPSWRCGFPDRHWWAGGHPTTPTDHSIVAGMGDASKDDGPIQRFRPATKAGPASDPWSLPATQQLLAEEALPDDPGAAVVDGMTLPGGPLAAPLRPAPRPGVADPDEHLMARSVLGNKLPSRKTQHPPVRAGRRGSGADWFDMPGTPMTPEIERDLRLLDSRASLDPKRFYKSTGRSVLARANHSEGLFFQVGEVVSSSHEFFSGRLTKKERRAHIMGEVMSDRKFRERTQKKYREIQDSRVARPKWKTKPRGPQRW